MLFLYCSWSGEIFGIGGKDSTRIALFFFSVLFRESHILSPHIYTFESLKAQVHEVTSTFILSYIFVHTKDLSHSSLLYIILLYCPVGFAQRHSAVQNIRLGSFLLC